MYTHIYETRYGDYKTHNIIKPSAILDIVQDIAIKHSDYCGYGLNTLKEMNLAWLIQGIKLHFNKPVKTGVPITAKTAIANMRGATSVRGCIIEQNGEEIAKTVTNWFLFDISSGRPARIPAEFSDKYGIHSFEDDFFSYSKPDMEKADLLYSIRVSNKEIDTNNHLNNQKSAELLMDALPFDFQFSDMNILYKKSAYLGDELYLCLKKTDNGFFVELQTKDSETCVAGRFEK